MLKNQKPVVSEGLLCTEENLHRFLKQRNSFSVEDQQKLKNLIDNDSKCWQLWNKVRWDAAMNSQGVQELKEYLGDKFIPYYDSSWGLAEEWMDLQPKTVEEIKNFYKKTKNYVYNLAIWHESGDRHKYSDVIEELIDSYTISSVTDYGCGIGTDSFTFIGRNIETYSIDFDCPASKFFKWRAKKRKLSPKFLDIEKLQMLPDTDMFWSIDVLEHIPNPLSTIKRINFKTCKIIAHKSQFNDTAGGRHPCHINFEQRIISDFLGGQGYSNVARDQSLSIWVNLNLVNKKR